MDIEKQKSLETEEVFHDEWANSENVEDVDVITTNEAITAPEMRYITKKMGDLKGKKVLDVGCGLGEASVYFALQGADVTATDLLLECLSLRKSLRNIMIHQ